jgi:putative glutamine amidotransferase
VLVPADGDPAAATDLISRLDALVLCGGRPLEPHVFTSHPRPTLEEIDPPRYRNERALILSALARRIPMLGICRGMQMINETLGGTLVRNLALDWPGALPHYQTEPAEHATHRVRFVRPSRLSTVINRDHAWVNSAHRQAVETPGAGLHTVAWADDGVIEAIETDGQTLFVIGVQFHPEALVHHHEEWLELFRLLVEAARLCAL